MSEIEKTIEELEAEVLAELEEATEKPLGKGVDLGLGSNNADEGAPKAKDPRLMLLVLTRQKKSKVRKQKTVVRLQSNQMISLHQQMLPQKTQNP